MTPDHRSPSSDRRRTGGVGGKVAASLATVATAAAVVALPTFGAFTDERSDFTRSVLAPAAAEGERRVRVP